MNLIKNRVLMEFSLQSLFVLMGILIALFLLPTLIPLYRYSLIGFGGVILVVNSFMMAKNSYF
ncbi:hypothetical protein ACFYKX_03655 [Cytobacillus sp. FJAT-54145]|uniref:Uncharacterized protein n=1 Tax=Cytobacillus spartinae TaxID=3299023 RepID=A0ABW6K6A3_9BACI